MPRKRKDEERLQERVTDMELAEALAALHEVGMPRMHMLVRRLAFERDMLIQKLINMEEELGRREDEIVRDYETRHTDDDIPF